MELDNEAKLGLILTLILLGFIGIAIAYDLYIHIQTNGVTASLNLEVYQSDGITILRNINWGTVGNLTYTNQTAIIKNMGNVPLVVSFITISLPNYLDLQWNLDSSFSLNPSEPRAITWMLKVIGNLPPNPISFNFEITVQGN